jgi:hypothetical protein
MLTNPEQVKQEGNLPETINDEKLETHIIKAVLEMKKIITVDKYEEIKNLDANDDDYITCSLAEANLTIAYALPSLNIETQGAGIVRTKGWDESRSDLLSQNELTKLCQHYRDVAMDLLKPFIPQVESTDIPADEVTGGNWKLTAL